MTSRTSHIARFLRSIRPLALVALTLHFFTLALHAEGGKTFIRLICPIPPADQTEVYLASRDDAGTWKTFHAIETRQSIITDWIQVPVTEIAFCVLQDEQLEPKATFTLNENSPRLLAILVPGEKEDELTSHLLDTNELNFGKGKMLILNTSATTCSVKLGTLEIESKPDEPKVAEPGLDENGMFHFTVGYQNAEGDPTSSYDRFVRGSKMARKLTFILPEPDSGINVFTMSDFGPFE